MFEVPGFSKFPIYLNMGHLAIQQTGPSFEDKVFRIIKLIYLD
jgi:hypothetical protein